MRMRTSSEWCSLFGNMSSSSTRKAEQWRNIDEDASRNDLFASDSSSTSLRHRKVANEEEEAQTVTEGLLELRQMMHGQVQHSQESLKALVNSSAKVQHIKEGMDDVGVNIKVGQGLISKLGRRDITDKVLIFLAFLFFISVVLYVIRKRLIGWII